MVRFAALEMLDAYCKGLDYVAEGISRKLRGMDFIRAGFVSDCDELLSQDPNSMRATLKHQLESIGKGARTQFGNRFIQWSLDTTLKQDAIRSVTQVLTFKLVSMMLCK